MSAIYMICTTGLLLMLATIFPVIYLTLYMIALVMYKVSSEMP